jgi:DNA integrity scanning protein DisA with diadenylate cyclase activity
MEVIYMAYLNKQHAKQMTNDILSGMKTQDLMKKYAVTRAAVSYRRKVLNKNGGMIKNSHETKLPALPVEQPTSPTDNLSNAQKNFNQAIVAFIDSEVKRRSESEITALKEKYEKELARMQAILIQAQNSSVVGMIKRKWGQID